MLIRLSMIALIMAGSAMADSVSLHEQVRCTDTVVRFKDVAELSGPAALALGDLVVANFNNDKATVIVTLASLRKLMTSEGTDWSAMSLRGFSKCEVSRKTLKKQIGIEAKQNDSVVANPFDEVAIESGPTITLRDIVISQIVQRSGVPGGDLRIIFAPRDDRVLNIVPGNHRVEVQPFGRSIPGRVPMVIRRFDGDRETDSYRVTADVTQRFRTAVTSRVLRRGQTITASDVEARDSYLTSLRDQPVTDLKALVGQTATTSLQPGDIIYTDHVQTPVMVRRGELVSVNCLSGGVIVRTVGRASGNGSMGDVISVRNERSRETFMVRVTGRRQGTVDQSGRELARGDKDQGAK